MKKLILTLLLIASALFAQTRPAVNAVELNQSISPFDTTSLKLYAVTLDSSIVELQRQADALVTLAKQHRAKAALLKRKRTLILNLVKTERKAK